MSVKEIASMHHLIIGSGIAGLSAAKAISGLDGKSRITLVANEATPFYYRPLLSHLIDGSRERADILMGEELIRTCNAEVIQDEAQGLKANDGQVLLGSGRTLSFDRLLIATGSRALKPNIPGADHALPLRTLADAERLRQAAVPGSKAVVIGGGLIGIKAAEALNAAGVQVTIVEQCPHLLYPKIDVDGAAFIAEQLTKAGITIHTGERVAAITAGSGVRLGSGQELAADLVVMAVGVRPNSEWLQASGLAQDSGLIVNDRLETSAPGVFAAGDVCRIPDLLTGKTHTSALWTNAVEMGRTAGVNMAGGKRRFAGGLLVLNATELGGRAIIAAGLTTADTGNFEIHSTQHHGSYRKLVFDGDHLVGLILIGDVQRAGLYVQLIRNRQPLGAAKAKAIRHTLQYADLALQ